MAFDKTRKENTERKYYFFEDSKTIAFKKKELSEEDKKLINKFNELQGNYNHEAEEEPVQE